MSRFVQETHKQKDAKKPQATLPKAGSYDLKALEVCLELKKSNDVLFWNVY